MLWINFTFLTLIQQCSDIDLTIVLQKSTPLSSFTTLSFWLQFKFKLFTYVYDLQFETFSLKRLNFKDVIIYLLFPFLVSGLGFLGVFWCLMNVLNIHCIKVCHLESLLDQNKDMPSILCVLSRRRAFKSIYCHFWHRMRSKLNQH